MGNIISPIKRLIKKNDYDNKYPIIKKIGFKEGQIELRDENKTGMDLYLSNKDEIIISKINLNQGAVAINHLENVVCSTHYQPYIVDYSKINKEYFINTIRSDAYKSIINAIKSNGIKTEFSAEQICDLSFPLPPLEIQNQIVNEYNEKIKLADEQEAKAKQLEQDIENYLLSELGIEIQKTEIKKGLQFVSFKEISRWGAENILGTSSNPFFSTKYLLKPLKDLLSINPTSSFTKLKSNTEISFIPMECISDEYGEVKENRTTIVAKSKGYTKFHSNDLIWARITPCMQNGKSAIVKNLINGYGCGSTEFHVFRCIDNQVLLSFIYHLFRSQYLLLVAKKYFTGSAGQQRVPASFFKELEIPLPPIEKQDEIVKKIEAMRNEIKELKNEAEANRAKAKENFEKEIFGEL